jgi:hypothetical protein
MTMAPRKQSNGRARVERRLDEEIASARATPGSPPSFAAPVRPRTKRLPFDSDELDFERFEQFCELLLNALPEVKSARRHGLAGGAQGGIDIVCEMADGSSMGVQCKKHKRFGKARVLSAISTTTFSADRYLIMLACRASAGVRETIDQHAQWELWDDDDIATLVRGLPREPARKLVEDTFGEAVREAFLGPSGPRLYQMAEEFFSPFLQKDRLFHHRWRLVGREQELEQLMRFVRSTAHLAVIEGRGGIGKTRLLKEFTSRVEASSSPWSVRFVDGNVAITLERVQSLELQPTLVVVDDAHRLDQWAPLLSLAARRAEPVKLIFVTRPHRVGELLAEAARAGIDPREMVRVELGELAFADVERLARQALGPKHRRLVHELARMTRDSPLVTALGGRVIARNPDMFEQLANDEEMRALVLAAFRDEMLGEIPDCFSRERTREVLELVSALGPMPVESDEVAEAAADFLEIKRLTFEDTIEALLEVGLLIRRGSRVRVTPDTLADLILAERCYRKDGRRSRWADAVFDRFFPLVPRQLLANLAELDWRTSRGRGEPSPLLDSIWQRILTRYDRSPNSTRSELLELLSRVAYYQPSRMIALSRHVLQQTHEVADTPHPLMPDYRVDRERLLYRLGPLLRGAAFTLDYLPDAVALLWKLGRDDDRPLNQFPDHPIRVLQDLTGYGVAKPLVMNKLAFAAMAEIARRADAFTHRHTPLDVTDALLAREGLSTSWRVHAFALEPFGIDREKTAELRRQGLDLLSELATSSDLRTARRAILSLGHATSEPHGLVNRTPTKEEREQWLPEQLDLIARLRAAARVAVDPLIHVEIARALSWHIEHSNWRTVRERAKRLVKTLPDTFDFRLTGILTDGWGLDWLPGVPSYRGDWERRHRQVVAIQVALAERFIAEFAVPSAGLDALERRVEQLRAADAKVEPGHFLYQLGAADVRYTISLAKQLATRSTSPLIENLPALLSSLHHRGGKSLEAARQVEAELIDSRDELLPRIAALGLQSTRWEPRPHKQDLALLDQALGHADPHVRALSMRTVIHLAQTDPHAAVQRVRSAVIDGNDATARELAMALGEHGIPIELLADDDLRRLLRQFDDLNSIDDYHIGQLLDAAAERVPDDVFELLLRRINHPRERETLHTHEWYQPIPFLPTQFSLEPLTRSENYRRYLWRVLTLAKNPHGGKKESGRGFWLPQLYELLSQFFTHPTSLDLAYAWATSGNEKKMKAAYLILTRTPRRFVFQHEEGIVAILAAADALGPDMLERARSALSTSPTTGSRSGTAGEPFPEDVALKEQAHDAKERQSDPRARDFYEQLERHAAWAIHDQIQREEEFLDQA